MVEVVQAHYQRWLDFAVPSPLLSGSHFVVVDFLDWTCMLSAAGCRPSDWGIFEMNNVVVIVVSATSDGGNEGKKELGAMIYTSA